MSLSPHLLNEKNVEVIDKQTGRLKCKVCHQSWSPNVQSGGRMPPRYWACPNGCKTDNDNKRHSFHFQSDTGKQISTTPFFENKIDSKIVPDDDGPEWLNTVEAADFLRRSPAALRNMTSNGGIPYHKLGRRNRYKRSDLRSLLLQNRRGGF